MSVLRVLLEIQCARVVPFLLVHPGKRDCAHSQGPMLKVKYIAGHMTSDQSALSIAHLRSVIS